MSLLPPTPCPLCGALEPVTADLRAVWRTAPWDISPRDRQAHHLQERWIPVCGKCASSAALFRVEHPREERTQHKHLTRTSLAGLATLILLGVMLQLGRGLTHSIPVSEKALYGLGWILLGMVLVLLLSNGIRALAYELKGREKWHHAWVEEHLARVLALPQGDSRPYWWELDLAEGLETRPRPEPVAPPRMIDSGDATTWVRV